MYKICISLSKFMYYCWMYDSSTILYSMYRIYKIFSLHFLYINMMFTFRLRNPHIHRNTYKTEVWKLYFKNKVFLKIYSWNFDILDGFLKFIRHNSHSFLWINNQDKVFFKYVSCVIFFILFWIHVVVLF